MAASRLLPGRIPLKHSTIFATFDTVKLFRNRKHRGGVQMRVTRSLKVAAML